MFKEVQGEGGEGEVPNRLIKESITTSSSINALSWEAECFFYRLIVNCDDYGRMDGRPAVLLAKCFPLRLAKVKEKNIQQWMGELERNDFLFLYKGDHEYLQIKSWTAHQQIRSCKSKYPEYDSVCHQMITSDIKCHRNPIQSNTNPTLIRASLAYDYFSDFYAAYPRKKERFRAEKAFSKLDMTDELMEKLMDALERDKRSKDWLKDDGQFIPYPATWLNGRRWEDGL